MKPEQVRILWLIIFFDLPVKTKPERRAATQFRNFLKDDGYMMLQYSVYARACRGEDAVEKHLGRVIKKLPHVGSVRTLHITERQYGRMRLLLGQAGKSERAAPRQLVLL